MTTVSQRLIKQERKLHAIYELDKRGIKYEKKNNGVHFIIQCDSGVEIHFWPTTEKVWFPHKGLKGKGLAKVLEWLKQEENPNLPHLILGHAFSTEEDLYIGEVK